MIDHTQFDDLHLKNNFNTENKEIVQSNQFRELNFENNEDLRQNQNHQIFDQQEFDHINDKLNQDLDQQYKQIQQQFDIKDQMKENQQKNLEKNQQQTENIQIDGLLNRMDLNSSEALDILNNDSIDEKQFKDFQNLVEQDQIQKFKNTNIINDEVQRLKCKINDGVLQMNLNLTNKNLKDDFEDCFQKKQQEDHIKESKVKLFEQFNQSDDLELESNQKTEKKYGNYDCSDLSTELKQKLDCSFNKIYEQIDILSQSQKKEQNNTEEFNKDFKMQDSVDKQQIKQKFQMKYEQFIVMQEKKKNLKEKYDLQEQLKMQTSYRTSQNSEKIIQKKGNYVPIQDRYKQINKQKEEKIKAQQNILKIQQENKELEQCSFSPITQRKKKGQFDQRSQEEFISSQYKWLENSKQKILNKKIEIQTQDLQNITHHPQINQNYQFKSPKYTISFQDRVKQEKQDTEVKIQNLRNQETPSFQPTINNKSIQIAFLKRNQSKQELF